MALLDKAKIALELLDSAQGHPVQTWRFEGEAIIRIGRADENDVTIVDPRVSRLHAELELRADGWLLISRGRNGILVDGTAVSEQKLNDGRTFQLGPNGPMLRFCHHVQPAHNVTTIDGIDPSIFDGLNIDHRKKDEEVQEIIGGSLFQQLKLRADELRRKNQVSESRRDAEDRKS